MSPILVTPSSMTLSALPCPLSPTYMPVYLHRSPSVSSLNTRQRSDFEVDLSSRYPAEEMPFNSEPALEGEQDPVLPAPKKLKPNGGGEEGGHVVCAKGILARKHSQDDPTEQGSELPPPAKGQAPLKEGAGGRLTPLSLSSLSRSSSSLAPSWGMGSSAANSWECSVTSSSRPMSRRSSSGASSCGSHTASSGYLKAVRFASGNGFGFSPLPYSPVSSPFEPSPPGPEPNLLDAWREHTLASAIEGCREKEEISGPVAAVVYLTHSREAYDRSPIVVDEAGLKLPPREKKTGDRGWIKCAKRAKKEEARAEAEAIKGQREKLRLEIEALGKDTASGARGTAASPLFRKVEPNAEDRCRSVRAAGSPSCSCTASLQVATAASNREAVMIESPASMSPATPPTRHSRLPSPTTPGPKALRRFSPTALQSCSEAEDLDAPDGLGKTESKGGERIRSAKPSGTLTLERTSRDEDDASVGGEDDDDNPQEDEEGPAEEEEEEEEEEDPDEEMDRRARRSLGMRGLGKWSRGDVFTCDVLGGF